MDSLIYSINTFFRRLSMCGDGSHRYQPETDEERKARQHDEVMAAQKKSKSHDHKHEKIAA